ncbi:MAG: ABC transporter substrate-binding protein [Longimicrobiales bacterium]
MMVEFESRSPLAGARAIRAWLEYALLCLLALCLAILAACDAGARAPDSGADPAYGGTFVVAAPADLNRANPLVTSDAYTMEINRFLLFMPLLRYGDEFTFEPYLAESWTMEGDTAITFALRRDVRWHDGERTTANDVVFTYDRVLNPETAYPNTAYIAAWTRVSAVDSFTVRVAFRPHADPLVGFALLPIVPAHLLESVPAAEMRNIPFNRAPVGNGPFRFVSQTANDRWVFEANARFPGALGGRPLLDRIVWRAIPDRQAQVTELLTGNADLALIPPADQYEQLAANEDLRGIERPSFKYVFVGWNGKRAPLGDARVRRALTMAMNRNQIVQVLRAGRATLASGPIHPNHWAFDPSIEPLPHDPAAAAALLDEAGLGDRDGDGVRDRPDGNPFAFDLEFQANNDFNRNMAEMIQADLARIGVRVTPRPLDWNTLVAHVSSTTRDFDAVLMGWEADFLVDVRDMFHSSALDGPTQLASYSNSAVDAALDLAATIADRDAALPIWQNVQRTLRDEQPWTFLYYFPDLLLVRERAQDIDMDLRGILATVTRWYIAEPSVATR